MRRVYFLLYVLMLLSVWSYAQPANDDCSGIITIPSFPYCSGLAEFTNVDATTSAGYGVPSGCSPSWQGDQRDVWFLFQAPAGGSPVDINIRVEGGTIRNPQVAVYRGDCAELAELACISAPNGSNTISLAVLQLDPGEFYYIRVNDWSSTGTPNAGTFTFCIEQYVPAVNISNTTVNTCSGTVYDSGGPAGDYSSNENFEFHICPASNYECIEINVVSYDLENTYDFVYIYDGPNTSSPLIGILNGAGTSQTYHAENGNCVTIKMTSDGSVVRDGFEITWQCTNATCDNGLPEPPDFSACTGLLYDNSGPFFDYGAGVTETYTICPSSPTGCFELLFNEYDLGFGDQINVYAGATATGTAIATITGTGTNGIVYVANNCATIRFTSNTFDNGQGFYVTWNCISSSPSCPPPPDLTACSGILFDDGGTFGDYSPNQTLVYSICPSSTFGCISLNFDYIRLATGDVFRIYEGSTTTGTPIYTQTGTDTGPSSFSTSDSTCLTIRFTSNSSAQDDGFVVTWQCSPFCNVPSFDCANALPICQEVLAQTNNTLTFDIEGFGDLQEINANNRGCFPNTAGGGQEDNSFWFYFKTATAGDVSFVMDNGNDVDFNVWGPYTDLNAICGSVISTQPIRSSWAAPGLSTATGLAIGNNDLWDCCQGTGNTPPNCNGAGGNGLVRPITAQANQYYIVLLNDYGSDGGESDVVIDFTPSTAGFDCTIIPTVVVETDTSICLGQSVQLLAYSPEFNFPTDAYYWTPADGLSCQICANPVATPTQTTTYVVAQQDPNNGSISYDSVTVTIISTSELTVTADTAICSPNIELSAIGFDSLVWSPAGLLSCSDCPNPTTNITETTLFTVIGYGACNNDTATVQVRYRPLFAETDSVNICTGDTIQIAVAQQDTGLTYLWSPMMGLSCTDCPNPLANPITTTVYVATVTNSFGCSIQDTSVVLVDQLVLFSVANDTLICEGSSVTLGSASNPSATYTWSPATGLNDANSSNPIATPDVTTSYTVTVVNGTCTQSDVVTVSVQATPQVDAGSDQTLCAGGNVNLQATSATGGTDFTWSPAAGLSCTGCANPVASPGATTTYTVTLVVGPCTVTDQVTVNVDTPVSFSVANDTLICEGSSVTLGSASNPSATYTWSPATGLNDANSSNPIATPDATTSYTVTVVNGACTQSDVVTVSVQATPQVDAGSDQTLCAGGSVNLQATSATGGTDFTWSPAAGLSCTGCANPVASPGATTTYTVTLVVGPCTVTDQVTVNVDTPVSFSVANDTTVCAGSSVQLGSSTNPAATYTWTPTTGLDDANSSNPLATPDATTTYSVTVVNGACTQTEAVTVSVIEYPSADIGADKFICIGESTQLAVADNPNAVYVWSPATGLSCTDCPNPTASPTGTTSYSVTVSVGTCSSSDEVVVNVSTEIDLVLTDQTICYGAQTSISNNTSTGDYTWAPATGLSCTDCPNPVAEPTQTTTYTVTAVNGACEASRTVTVTVIPPLQVSAGNDVNICGGTSTQLNASGNGEGNTFTWSPADGLSCTNCPNPTAQPNQTTTYTVTYSSDGNCAVTDEVQVAVETSFSVEISTTDDDSTINQGESIDLTANILAGSQSGLTIQWTPSTGLSNTNTLDVTASPLVSTNYCVNITSPFGCQATDCLEVNVLDPNYGIPNAFTPNGDDKNDYFAVIYNGNITVPTFQIYDRWGQLVYDQPNFNLANDKGWDGTYDGKLLPNDVYVYYIVVRKPDGTQVVEKGDLTLIR